jgi:hypothetical protein
VALDYKILPATAVRQSEDLMVACSDSGQTGMDPIPEPGYGSPPFPWRATILLVVGLALALTFGLRTWNDYPRMLRDRAVLQAATECLAQTGGRSDCVPSSVAPDGSTDFAIAVIVEQSAASQHKLGRDLLGLAGGIVILFGRFGVFACRRLRPKALWRRPSVVDAIRSVGEGLLTVTYPLILILVGDLLGAPFVQGIWLTRALLDRATDGVLAVFFLITGGV